MKCVKETHFTQCLQHEECCLNNATERNLEVTFSYNKNLQNEHNFSKSTVDIKLPRFAKYVERNRREKTICSHFEVVFLNAFNRSC